MNTLIDTHCHITCDALYERIDEVLENARQAGIEKMLIIHRTKGIADNRMPLYP